MTDNQTTTIKECASRSLAGTISFGEVVARLSAAGIERYHADYTRGETTYYLPGGESLVIPTNGVDDEAIAEAFSPPSVESSVRQAQRGEIMYPQFVRQTCAAGCVGYFVQISGKRVQYFGRTGEVHTEWFPGAKPN